MKLQHNFYDVAKVDVDASELRPLPEMGEERRELLEKAYQRIEERERKYKRVLNEDKYDAFCKISKQAVALAKFLPANIMAETQENGEGVIVLRTDMLLLESRDSKEYAQTIAQLFTTADTVFCCTADEGLPYFVFTFILYDLVER